MVVKCQWISSRAGFPFPGLSTFTPTRDSSPMHSLNRIATLKSASIRRPFPGVILGWRQQPNALIEPRAKAEIWRLPEMGNSTFARVCFWHPESDTAATVSRVATFKAGYDMNRGLSSTQTYWSADCVRTVTSLWNRVKALSDSWVH